jgi:DNA repair exonuclease SbcCD ATPase subunit
MTTMKKKPADEFRVPSLGEADPTYAALVAKRDELNERYRGLNAERSRLGHEIEEAKAAGGERLNADVARLLGDSPEGSVSELSRQLREVVIEMGNIESAQEVLRRRIDEARNIASKTVCATVRQEYQRRLGAVCDAAKILESAREQHDALLDDIEREDVSLAHLRPVRAHFLGDRRDGKVSHFLREVSEAGHNV